MKRTRCQKCGQEIVTIGMQCQRCANSAILNFSSGFRRRDTATDHGDPVRREAFEEAMQKLAGRRGLYESLSESERREILELDGPEVLGTWPETPRRP